jgi:MuDR family transposase
MYTMLIMPTASRPTLSHLPDPYVIGSVYGDLSEAKDALLQYTVAKRLSYRLKTTDHRRYIVKCRSESCTFRLRFTIHKSGTAKTTVSRGHTCSPETHFEWKGAKSVKYLRLNYQDTMDANSALDAKKIQAAEEACGNRLSYRQSWRAARSIRAHAAGIGSVWRKPYRYTTSEPMCSRLRSSTIASASPDERCDEEDNLKNFEANIEAVADAARGAQEGKIIKHEILEAHEVRAELDRMPGARMSHVEIRRRGKEPVAPRYEALEDAHHAYLLGEIQKYGRMPPPVNPPSQEDKFVTVDTFGLFQCASATHPRK